MSYDVPQKFHFDYTVINLLASSFLGKVVTGLQHGAGLLIWSILKMQLILLIFIRGPHRRFRCDVCVGGIR